VLTWLADGSVSETPVTVNSTAVAPAGVVSGKHISVCNGAEAAALLACAGADPGIGLSLYCGAVELSVICETGTNLYVELLQLTSEHALL
jgi:hypothetical protein